MTADAAGFAPTLSLVEGEPGAVVEVAFPYDGSMEEIAAFRTQVEYDPDAFEYLRPTYGESVQTGTVTTRSDPGRVSSVYTASRGGPYLMAETTVTYRFRVLEEASPGSYSFFVSAFDLSSPVPSPIAGDVDVSLDFRVLTPPSDDARLVSLAPDSGTLSPGFSPDVFAYSMTVPYEVDEVVFTAETVSGASCRVNRKTLGAGGSDTLFEITVTAEDGKTKNVYSVTVHREEQEPLSDDARLLSLTPETGTLSPAFDPDRLTYSLTVPYEVTTMAFDAQPAEGATYRVNRKNLGSGGSDTLFTITVTAEDGETRHVYQVTVHREEKEEDQLRAESWLTSLKPASGVLSPAFDPENLEYTLTVPYEVTTMTFDAQPAEGATYRVNRKNLGSGGSDTLFTITVTAEDGEHKTVYQVTVHRSEKEETQYQYSADARLLSLTPASGTLSPAFSSDHLTYTLTVPYEVTTMTFDAQPTEGASYRVNRKNLGSGGSDTPFTITVTAEDGEHKTVYQVTVHRGEKVSAASTGTTSNSTTSGASGSSSQGTAVQSAGDLAQTDSPTSEGENFTESLQPSLDTQETAAGTVEAGGGESSKGSGVVVENGSPFLLPGMLVMVLFVLFCFLSGPLSKWLAQRFPRGEETDSPLDGEDETPSK
ncbi:MAG: cadherin-like beta sandwich domain-containing protein [Acutalibacter sp.]